MATAHTLDRTESLTERDVKREFTKAIALENPVTTTIGSAPGQLETIHEWGWETYPDRSTDGVLEGADPADADFRNTVGTDKLLSNRFIKQWEPIAVTKEMQLMHNQYSVPQKRDFMAKQLKTFGTVIMSKVEKTLLSDTEAVEPSKGVTASKLRTILRWISNNNSRYTDTKTTPHADTRAPVGNIVVSKAAASDVTEPEIGGMITSVVKSRRKAGLRFMGLCTPDMRDVFDGYSKTDKQASNTNYPVYQFNQSQGSIDREVTRYKSSNGAIELMTVHDLPSTCHFVLMTPDMWKKSYAQGIKVNNEGASSQVEKKVIDVIYTLECLLAAANGKVITTATA
jgi:hypothetical protein